MERQLRTLEEQRDQLLERLAAYLPSTDHLDGLRSDALPASVLPAVEGALKAIQPVLEQTISARNQLIAERSELARRKDSADDAESEQRYLALDALITELTTSMTQMDRAVQTLRASAAARTSNESNAG